MLFYVVGGLRVVWVRIFASIVGGDGGLRDCVCVMLMQMVTWIKWWKEKKMKVKKKNWKWIEIQ